MFRAFLSAWIPLGGLWIADWLISRETPEVVGFNGTEPRVIDLPGQMPGGYWFILVQLAVFGYFLFVLDRNVRSAGGGRREVAWGLVQVILGIVVLVHGFVLVIGAHTVRGLILFFNLLV